mmetsp:Transcript_524/g.1413  ORF Transcript_524/g.1413 Transcript_524/m.1413 type:complete len:426 (-) Transcript_524:313-1590(-)
MEHTPSQGMVYQRSLQREELIANGYLLSPESASMAARVVQPSFACEEQRRMLPPQASVRYAENPADDAVLHWINDSAEDLEERLLSPVSAVNDYILQPLADGIRNSIHQIFEGAEALGERAAPLVPAGGVTSRQDWFPAPAEQRRSVYVNDHPQEAEVDYADLWASVEDPAPCADQWASITSSFPMGFEQHNPAYMDGFVQEPTKDPLNESVSPKLPHVSHAATGFTSMGNDVSHTSASIAYLPGQVPAATSPAGLSGSRYVSREELIRSGVLSLKDDASPTANRPISFAALSRYESLTEPRYPTYSSTALEEQSPLSRSTLGSPVKYARVLSEATLPETSKFDSPGLLRSTGTGMSALPLRTSRALSTYLHSAETSSVTALPFDAIATLPRSVACGRATLSATAPAIDPCTGQRGGLRLAAVVS